ncbi:hypothetical protein BH09MYX1_BH09MYX1_54160 [soil metagenome]
MIPLLSRAQIRAFDAHAIEKCAVPSLLLMENAARGATDVLVTELLSGDAREKSVLVLCGTGNNGGDGFAIARRLLVLGAHPVVLVFGDESKLTADAKINCDAFRGIGGSVASATAAVLDESIPHAHAIVDALFGTGLSRPLEGAVRDVVARLQAHHAKVLAVDIPSGLDAEKGIVLGAAVRAAITVTFAHWKLGLATPIGADYTGRVVVCDIGVPAALASAVSVSANLATADEAAAWLVPRANASHKYSAGHVAVLAGSTGGVGEAHLVG